MVHLQTSFFTDAIVDEIRKPQRGARKTFFNKYYYVDLADKGHIHGT